jgi:hypothetical protein
MDEERTILLLPQHPHDLDDVFVAGPPREDLHALEAEPRSLGFLLVVVEIAQIDDGADAELLEVAKAFGRRLLAAIEVLADAVQVRHTLEFDGLRPVRRPRQFRGNRRERGRRLLRGCGRREQRREDECGEALRRANAPGAGDREGQQHGGRC